MYDEKVLQQDLSQPENPGTVFMMRLLMKEPCKMPDRDKMINVMQKYIGDIECFCHDEKVAGFAVKKYIAEFKDANVPPQLMVMGCTDASGYVMDPIEKSQMWDCENSEEILEECKYEVIVSDMLAAALKYKERADMLMDCMEALMELYPTCEAVHFISSGKLVPRDKIVRHNIPQKDRFIYFAVNVRFFNIQGTDDMMVDTLGMSTLFLPDLQYHFHGMDPNWVVNHAYNTLSYIYDNDCPIKDGDTIDGVSDGKIDWNIQWKCHFEDALIQPARPLLDICMGEYASGKRN